MYQVVKRDGTIAPFTLDKIIQAITKAFIACQKPYSEDVIERIALRVTSDFCDKVKDGLIGVEDIQDSVENVLANDGYYDVSKAYILYRKQRENVRKLETNSQDYKKIFAHYFTDENATDSYSVGGLILNNSGMLTRNYWLSDIYEENVVNSYMHKEIYIHDLDMFAGRRACWSLKQLLQVGILPIKNNISSGPSKHLSTLCSQLINFLGILQNEWAQEQYISSFDTYLSILVKKDSLTYEQVKQSIQTFIYGINVPSRWGSKPPHTIIECDGKIPTSLRKQYPVIAEHKQSFTYGECTEELELVQKALLEVLEEGDYEGKNFQYPIVYYHIDKDSLQEDSEVYDLIVKVKKKYRSFYFTTKPMLHSSLGMVSIDVSKLKEEADTRERFYTKLDAVLHISMHSLETKKNILDSFLKSGLYPYTRKYGVSFKEMHSSIGIVGLETIEDPRFCLQYIQDKLLPGIVLEKCTDENAYKYFDKELPTVDTIDFLSYLDKQKEIYSFYEEQSFCDVQLIEELDSWKEAAVMLETVLYKYHFKGVYWE